MSKHLPLMHANPSDSYRKCAFHAFLPGYSANMRQHDAIMAEHGDKLATLTTIEQINIRVVFHFVAPTSSYESTRVEARADDVIMALNEDFNNYAGDPNSMNNHKYKRTIERVFPSNEIKQGIYNSTEYANLVPSEPSNITFELAEVYYYKVKKRLDLQAPDGTASTIDPEQHRNIISRHLMQSTAIAVMPNHFLNIWIIDTIGSPILSYASFPWEQPDKLHGIIVNRRCFFPEDYGEADFSSLRTFTHGAGHYLGLLHVPNQPRPASTLTDSDDSSESDDETIDGYDSGYDSGQPRVTTTKIEPLDDADRLAQMFEGEQEGRGQLCPLPGCTTPGGPDLRIDELERLQKQIEADKRRAIKVREREAKRARRRARERRRAAKPPRLAPTPTWSPSASPLDKVRNQQLHYDPKFNPLFMNFMDHTCDKFVSNFTKNQLQKMYLMIKLFRPNLNSLLHQHEPPVPRFDPDEDRRRSEKRAQRRQQQRYVQQQVTSSPNRTPEQTLPPSQPASQPQHAQHQMQPQYYAHQQGNQVPIGYQYPPGPAPISPWQALMTPTQGSQQPPAYAHQPQANMHQQSNQPAYAPSMQQYQSQAYQPQPQAQSQQPPAYQPQSQPQSQQPQSQPQSQSHPRALAAEARTEPTSKSATQALSNLAPNLSSGEAPQQFTNVRDQILDNIRKYIPADVQYYANEPGLAEIAGTPPPPPQPQPQQPYPNQSYPNQSYPQPPSQYPQPLTTPGLGMAPQMYNPFFNYGYGSNGFASTGFPSYTWPYAQQAMQAQAQAQAQTQVTTPTATPQARPFELAQRMSQISKQIGDLKASVADTQTPAPITVPVPNTNRLMRTASSVPTMNGSTSAAARQAAISMVGPTGSSTARASSPASNSNSNSNPNSNSNSNPRPSTVASPPTSRQPADPSSLTRGVGIIRDRATSALLPPVPQAPSRFVQRSAPQPTAPTRFTRTKPQNMQ